MARKIPYRAERRNIVRILSRTQRLSISKVWRELPLKLLQVTKMTRAVMRII